MRDILKKLRCGGSTAAASKRASDTYEEPKDDETEEGQQDSQAAENMHAEEKKQLLEEGVEIANKMVDGKADEIKTEENNLENGNEEQQEDEKNEKKEGKEEGKEETQEEDKNVAECGIENQCEGVENVDKDEAEADEDENLLKGDQEEEKHDKKGKKKEGSRWICGLGSKKANKERPEKKKKEEKKTKKTKKGENEEGDKEGLTENEKKLINGDDETSQGEGKDKPCEEKDEEVNEKEDVKTEENETNTNAGRNDEVVVFVTESEAVVEETHHAEASVETNEECCIKGDGLVKGIKGEATSFQIHSCSEDVFSFICKVQDANGNEVVVEIEHVEGNLHKATYYPSSTGIHTIEALWKGQRVIGSPFQVSITENAGD